MKHLKSFNLINEGKKAELNFKIKEIKVKLKEVEEKIDETKSKANSEMDPVKQELIILNLQKLAAKRELLELDIRITKLQRTIL
jgi:hypothetical protein